MRKYVSKKIKIVPTFTKDDLVDALITEFDAPVDITITKSRKRIYSDARKVYCKIAVYNMGRTRLNIAKDFPGYDHTIVTYSIDIFNKLYDTDVDFKEKVDRVYTKLGIDNTK